MAKEKMNVELNQDDDGKVVEQSINSLEIGRNLYENKKTKEKLYEYYVDATKYLPNLEGHELRVKITCHDKDIQLFDLIDLMFLNGTPKLIYRIKQYENSYGEIQDSTQYFIVGNAFGKDVEVRAKPMKESDKVIVESIFEFLEAKAAK